MRKLTREQQLAFARDRHISITANAGSGKTTVLIDKFIDILLNDDKVDLDPTRILAITFTRIAASEMFTRAAEAIESFIAAEKNETNLKKLFKVRERLSYAKITTFHSFCSGLLREYPIEANISPNFTELSEFDVAKLKEEALDKVISSKIQPDTNSVYTNFFDCYGIKTINDILHSIISKPDIFQKVKEIYLESDETLANRYQSAVNDFLTDKLDELLNYIGEVSYEKDENLQSKHLIVYRKCVDDLITVSANWSVKDSITKEDLLSLFTVLNVRISRTTFKNYIKKFSDYEEEIEDILKTFTIFSNLDDEFDNFKQIGDVRLLVEIIEEFFEDYRALKDTYNGIDYDDMIFRVRDMLRDEEVARRVRKEYDYILVDEFQDTNIAQYDIIKALVPNLTNPIINDDIRCFIVGDGKQSIYGFRGADVSVFNQAIKDIGKCNSAKINDNTLSDTYYLPAGVGFGLPLSQINTDNENEQIGNLSLSCSFRLLPVVAGFVNYYFQKLASKNLSSEKFDYEDLVCGRETNRLPEITEDNDEISADSNLGTVSVLISLYDKHSEKQNDTTENDELYDDFDDDFDDSIREADIIANHIAQIVHSDSRYSLWENGLSRQPNYADIAILSRNKKGFATLANSFLCKNIPFVILSGQGFFASPEITDISSFLMFLSDNKDDLAFASILKSPFFGFSANELYEVSLCGNRYDSFYEKFKLYFGTQSEVNENYIKTKRAMDICELMLFYSTRIPISSLIVKIIETGGYWGVIAKSPSGSIIEANFEKFIEYARNFEAKGFKSLSDFIEELSHLAANSKEPEAVHHTAENAVKLVTIHGAKGAEFPIVYLYSTNTSSIRISEPFLDGSLGLFFKYRERNGAIVSSEESPIYHIAKNNIKNAEKAEQNRILYVALTRARDHLIITGELQKNPKEGYRSPSGYLKQILKAIDISHKDITPDINISKKFGITQKFLIDGQFVPLKFNFKVHFSTCVDYFETINEISEQKIDYKIMLEPIQDNFSNGLFSASRLTEFLYDNEEYFIKNHLLLDEHREIISPNRQTQGQMYGMIAGSIIHEVMENIKLWLEPDGNIKNDVLRQIMDTKLKKYGQIQADDLRDRLLSECIAVVSTDFIKKHTAQIREAVSEAELNMPFGDDFLTGSIDCLIETEANFFEVWDWKSNRIHCDEDFIRLREHYSLQMETYAYFLMLLKPELPKYICRLLFTNRAAESSKDTDWIVTYEFSKSDMMEIETKISSLILGTRI